MKQRTLDSEETNEPGHTMLSEYFLCTDLRAHDMGHGISEVMCNISCKYIYLYFIGLLQVYTDKTATALKSIDLVAYPIYVVNLTSFQHSGSFTTGTHLQDFFRFNSKLWKLRNKKMRQITPPLVKVQILPILYHL